MGIKHKSLDFCADTSIETCLWGKTRDFLSNRILFTRFTKII